MTLTDVQFWDKIAPKYSKQPVADVPGYHQTLQHVQTLLNEDDRVLELGCGTGTTAIRLAPHVMHWTATDISPKMIEIAKAKQQPDNIEFMASDIDNLSSDEGFDAVCAFNLLHLVPNLDDALRKIHMMTKPGGLFISKSGCLSDMFWGLRLIIPIMQMIGKAPKTILNLTENELVAKISNAGFDIVEVTTFGKGKNVPYIVARRPL